MRLVDHLKTQLKEATTSAADVQKQRLQLQVFDLSLGISDIFLVVHDT